MVMYSEYRRYEEHDGLVEDKSSRYSGFQDIQALNHWCAQVSGAGEKITLLTTESGWNNVCATRWQPQKEQIPDKYENTYQIAPF